MLPPHDSSADESVDGSLLCVQCGLCCDGTLFSHLPIDDDEVERVTFLGGRIETRSRTDGTEFRALTQRCSLLKDRCCSVYEERPRGCHNYVCRLLGDYQSGRRSLDECLEIVRTFEAAVADAEPARARHPGGALAALAEDDQLAIGIVGALKGKYF